MAMLTKDTYEAHVTLLTTLTRTVQEIGDLEGAAALIEPARGLINVQMHRLAVDLADTAAEAQGLLEKGNYEVSRIYQALGQFEYQERHGGHDATERRAAHLTSLHYVIKELIKDVEKARAKDQAINAATEPVDDAGEPVVPESRTVLSFIKPSAES